MYITYAPCAGPDGQGLPFALFGLEEERGGYPVMDRPDSILRVYFENGNCEGNILYGNYAEYYGEWNYFCDRLDPSCPITGDLQPRQSRYQIEGRDMGKTVNSFNKGCQVAEKKVGNIVLDGPFPADPPEVVQKWLPTPDNPQPIFISPGQSMNTRVVFEDQLPDEQSIFDVSTDDTFMKGLGRNSKATAASCDLPWDKYVLNNLDYCLDTYEKGATGATTDSTRTFMFSSRTVVLSNPERFGNNYYEGPGCTGRIFYQEDISSQLGSMFFFFFISLRLLISLDFPSLSLPFALFSSTSPCSPDWPLYICFLLLLASFKCGTRQDQQGLFQGYNIL